jgi:hypothetical protein
MPTADMLDGVATVGGVKASAIFSEPLGHRTEGLCFVLFDGLPARAVPMKPTTFPPGGVCIREYGQRKGSSLGGGIGLLCSDFRLRRF